MPPLEALSDDCVVSLDESLPGVPTKGGLLLGRADDVGEQDRGEDRVEFWHRGLDPHETPDLIEHGRLHLG